MQNKLIFILLDGLCAKHAHEEMGFMGCLSEAQKAVFFKIFCELPPLSRPIYNCLLTANSPAISGIVSNELATAKSTNNFFSLAKENGLITAASAYFWFSELCNNGYNEIKNRFTNDENLAISHGIFYNFDDYPDAQVFIDAEILRQNFNPHILLIHSMGIDNAGHLYGAHSTEYRKSIRKADMLLAKYIPTWLNLGYNIIIASDHGMDDDKQHNGNNANVREVPLWFLGEAFNLNCQAAPAQTELCGIICEVLKLKNHKKAVYTNILN